MRRRAGPNAVVIVPRPLPRYPPLPPPTPEARAAMASTVDWLLLEGPRAPDMRTLVEHTAERLAAILPLRNLAMAAGQLHPEVFAEVAIWTRDAEMRHGLAERAFETRDDFLHTPAAHILSGAAMVRHGITEPEATSLLEFESIPWMRDEGFTDAVWLSLGGAGIYPNVLCATTDAPAGFDDHQVACLAAVRPAVAAIVEIQATRALAAGLLDIYVGRDAGARILAGQIRRGDATTVEAAIWFSDLAGFTALSERLPRDAVIAILNAHFDAMAGPVDRQGGTILKFLGDGMLAIFPLADGASARDACRRAVAAAEEACGLMDGLDVAGSGPLGFGVALHLGEVTYGNIGAAHRLDFTVIGPAVNLTARLEELSRRLPHRVVLSAPFARAAGLDLPPIGTFPLRGIAEPQTVFGLPLR